ncbi:MAG: alpha/beta hydrolase [Acidimicrobiales bacterium]
MQSDRSRHVDAGGLNIWIEEWGDPEGTPVFLCQRMGAQSFEWEPTMLAALVDAGYRVVGHDYRGFGYSEPGLPERYEFIHLVNDALGAIDALELGPAHIVGTSMGGVLARWMVLTRPSIALSLTMLSSSPGDMKLPIGSPEFTAVASNPPGPSVEAREDYIVRELTVLSDERLDSQRALARAREAVNRGWYLDEMRRLMRAANKRTDEERVWQNSTAIDVPMFIAHGTTDTVLPVVHGYALAEMYPSAELLIIEGMSHELQPHYFEELWPRWSAFLRSAGG